MERKSFIDLPPEMVLGVVNEQLRIACKDLQDLAAKFDLDSQDITRRLDHLGYHYDEASNQFKPH